MIGILDFVKILKIHSNAKQLENKKTIVNNMKGAKHAREVIAKSLKAYVDKFVEYEPFAY